jgi:vanillate O-demethylase monooxygenase subunit
MLGGNLATGPPPCSSQLLVRDRLGPRGAGRRPVQPHRARRGDPALPHRRRRITALRDRCCHRLAPLSKGRKEGDCVRCGYHGLLFDATGRCIEIPGSDTVPPKARVQRYPLAVKNKWVFVWMGDPAKADPALLPDNFSCDSPEWDYLPGYMHYSTPQQLICDNLLDFSHLSYVHEKTLGGSTAIAQARAEIESVPRGIRVTRKIHDVPPPPYYRAVREPCGNLDRWFVYDFVLPGTLLMHSGGRPVRRRRGATCGARCACTAARR